MPSNPNAGTKLSPILGLPIYDGLVAHVDAQPAPAHLIDVRYELSVIIPARDEELNLPGCLESLLAQNDKFFALGTDWELIIVDDASTDRTAKIAREAAAQQAAVRVLQTPPLDAQAFTGKTQACWLGAQSSRGRWLLFTDADTLHEPSDLIHSLHEAKRHTASLLSYSPRQIVHGAVQHALMPLIFSELASVYPTAQVNDPASRTAAANGQFLLVEREAYFAVGGHKAVGASVLEDVDLAWNVKRSKRNLRFRYAPEALSTRMYRTLGEMMEGWTKNLALLFPHALACWLHGARWISLCFCFRCYLSSSCRIMVCVAKGC